MSSIQEARGGEATFNEPNSQPYCHSFGNHAKTMKTHLVLTFTSPDRPGIVEELTKVVVQHGGNWEESRLARLCGDFAGIARITVEADQKAAVTANLKALESRGLVVVVKETHEPDTDSDFQVAKLVCSGADHEGIVSGVASQLSRMGINVEGMETSIVPAPTTGTPVFQMACRLRLPESCDPKQLRADLERLEYELGTEIRLDIIDARDTGKIHSESSSST